MIQNANKYLCSQQSQLKTKSERKFMNVKILFCHWAYMVKIIYMRKKQIYKSQVRQSNPGPLAYVFPMSGILVLMIFSNIY